MNDDSDGSEYVDEDEVLSNARHTKRASAKAKSTERKHGSMAQTGHKQELSREPSAASEGAGHGNTVNGNTNRKIDIDVLRVYRDLLDTTIADVFGSNRDDSSDPLPPSQIGASFWTTLEKQYFFTALRSYGPGNLLALSSAVGTKSEPEIKAYILLLQEGARELDTKSAHKFTPADAPAAVEIGAECLEVEELLASAIEDRARAAEEKLERQKWGSDSWLIDAEAAAEADDAFDDINVKTADDDEEEGEEDAAPAIKAQADGASDGQSDSRSSPPSDHLLKLSAFLDLSNTIFMNSKSMERNWNTLTEDDESHPGPSMRRTAFEDYYNLVISLTRRLMQVSIFQAVSRLRASSDQRLLPIVNGHDVHAARNILGMETRDAKYWAEATQRCGVEVYSDSKKWRVDSGRKGTKNGFKLSKAELEAELGGRVLVTAARSETQSDIEGYDLDQSQFDSDDFTLASSSERSDDEASDSNEAEPADVSSNGRSKADRKRPLSPASFNRAETQYLESLDRMNSTAGENELRSLFDMDPLPETRSQKPAFLYKEAEVEPRVRDWREAVQYDAPWEQPYSMPQQRRFDEMGTNGAKRRKRRRLARQTSGELMADQDYGSSQDMDSELGSDDGEKLSDGKVVNDVSEDEEVTEDEDESEEDIASDTNQAGTASESGHEEASRRV